MAAKRNMLVLDPEQSYKRHLHYLEKHSGWHIFRAIYVGIYLFIMGILLATLVPNTLSYHLYIGWGLMLLALFVIIYGFTTALHLRLMKRYA